MKQCGSNLLAKYINPKFLVLFFVFFFFFRSIFALLKEDTKIKEDIKC